MGIIYPGSLTVRWMVPPKSEPGPKTTVNTPRDFFLGKRLGNLPALRQVGFQASRRLLEVERLCHDCAVGEETKKPCIS